MRWHNHKLVTFSVVYAATGGVVPSVCSMAGSLLPDVLEIGGLVPHRTYTHWPYPYLVALGSMYLINMNTTHIWPFIFFFVILGATLHLLEDTMSVTGIPFGTTPKKKFFGMGIYLTCGWSEELVTLVMVAVFMFLAWFRGFFLGEHIAHQIKQIVGLGGLIIGGGHAQ